MGSSNSTPEVQHRAPVPSPPKCPTGPAPAAYELSATDLYPALGASGRHDETSEDQTAAPRNMAKEVVQCSVLLRQMFALDLDIWAMGGCVEEEVARREELKRKADSLFAEIRWMVNGLSSMADVVGSVEEKRQIREICGVLYRHESSRYVVDEDKSQLAGV